MNFNLLVGLRNELRQIKDTYTLDEVMNNIETTLVRMALKECDYDMTKTAKRLGINYRSMRYRVKKLHIPAGRQLNEQPGQEESK